MCGKAKNHVRLIAISSVLLCAAVAAISVVRAAEAGGPTFSLKEVSVFDLPPNSAQDFLIGQRTECGSKADPNVTKYPRFESSQPLYGRVDFSDPIGGKDARIVCPFALDESGGMGKGYDRLYFDLNHDRDLTNDGVVAAQKKPSPKAMLNYAETTQVCFENVAVPLPCGSEGQRPLEMMPRLTISQGTYKMLSLVTTKAFQGRIRLGGRTCNVLLGHGLIASSWFDRPFTALHVTPEGSNRPWDWWGGNRLNAIHKVDGVFYTFSATPAGDKLTVHRYTGPLGTLVVDAGGRKIERLEIAGSLRSEKTGVAVGEPSSSGERSYTRSCQLPIGDYLPEYIHLEYGKLRIGLSNNYHTDGKPRDMTNRQWVYGIHIREDKPFAFDFSNKPAVLFASPARDFRIKCGEELTVKAVLIDPAMDFMIRDLSDTSRKQQKQISNPDGTSQTVTQGSFSLDPKVTIARANGEIVAEGVMPFG